MEPQINRRFRPLRSARRPRHRGLLLGRWTAIAAISGLLAAMMTACSSSACGSTPATFAATEALRIGQVTPTSATLLWSQQTTGGKAEGYRIYRGPAGAAAAGLSLIATIDPDTSYDATHLRSGVNYTFGVAAIDLNNTQHDLRTTTVSIPPSHDATPPRPPSNSSLSPVAFSANRVDVTWGASPSDDIAAYEVHRDGLPIGTIERPNWQRFSDNGLAPGSTHSYSVLAVDSAGNRSAATAAKSVTTLADGEVTVVRGPYLSVVTDRSAIISWWTNLPSPGSVTVAGTIVDDPAGITAHHAVTISGLAPGQSYPYTVSSEAASQEGTLRTAAPPGQSFSFAAIGDFGTGGPGQIQNAANIAAASTDFVQTLGDNIYPSAGPPDPDFSTTYSDFDSRLYEPMRAVLANQAFFPANGNKEYYSDGQFWANFPMPGDNHSWYSYNWGDAHVVVLDTEQPFDPNSEQYTFLRADLNAHQSEAWRIAVFQRPPYSSTSEYSSSPDVARYLVPLFQTHRVALVLAGNSHNYERTHPLINGAPAAKGGITYVVSGAGGNSFNIFSTPQPAYSAFREDTVFEFVKVTVSPSTLQVDAISGDTNTVLDSTTISITDEDHTPPTAPTGLTAKSATAHAVSLSWQPSTDDGQVGGYEIYRDGNAKPIGTSATTGFTDSGLTPSHSHTYTVVAVDQAGNSSLPSFAVSASTTTRDADSDDTSPSGASAPSAGTARAAGPARNDCANAAAPITSVAPAVRRFTKLTTIS